MENDLNYLLLYNDPTILERAILSCLFMKPKLTDELIIQPSDFKKHRGLLMFMQQFYKQYRNYDLTLMAVMCVNKRQFIDEAVYIIAHGEPSTGNFVHYQEQLKKLNAVEIEEKKNINRIIDLTIKLKSRIMSVEEFKKEVDNI